MERHTLPVPRYVLFFFTFACIGVGVWFLNAYASLFNSVFLAMMIVMTASPVGFWLKNHGVPGWLSLTISVLVALGATLLIALILGVAMVRLINMVPLFVEYAWRTRRPKQDLY